MARDRLSLLERPTTFAMSEMRPGARLIVVVPTRDRFGRSLARAIRQRMQRDLEDVLVSTCGGATVLGGLGLWRTHDCQVIRESVRILIALLPPTLSRQDGARIIATVSDVSSAADQDALLVMVDDEPFFVRPRVLAHAPLQATS